MHGMPALRWDDLSVMLAVLRTGSFSAAAVLLDVEQSTVSRRIASLEETLSGTLFDRNRSGLKPTDLAVRLRDHAERVEAEVQRFVDVAGAHEREVQGRVRLAVTESVAVHLIVPRVLPELRARYPKLDVDLVTSDLSADLGRREADLALRFYRPRSGDLVAKRVARMRTSVLAHRSYPKRRLRKLAAHDWIALSIPGIESPEEELLDSLVGVEPRLRTNGYLTQVAAVRAGLGIALLTRSLLELDPELIELPLKVPSLPVLELWLVAPRVLRSLPRVDALFTFLEGKLAALHDAD